MKGHRAPRDIHHAPGDTGKLATIGEWLAFAEKLYARENVALGQVATNAHDEALYLLLRTLGLPLDADARVLDQTVTASERTALETMLMRRVFERIPAAYLTREAWLGEHRFYVDERVIIPRSYFLEIIPDQLDRLLPPAHRGKNIRHAVDVCTGSGCLAILLAHPFPSAQVDACDLSRAALAVAAINVREHQLEDRVRLFESDVFDAVPARRYDIILSNPPYEPTALVDRQTPEFAAEPRMAHDGGRDGLVIIRKLLRQARTRLQPHGIVVIEAGGLRVAIEREFAELRPEWLHTQDGSDCVVLFRAKNFEEWPAIGR
ncbi:MAG: 50S ribosomal protein L3 N(5)-glutamine methyltransferase [Opitutaceae bacterium]